VSHRHKILRSHKFTPNANAGAPKHKIITRRNRIDEYPILHLNKEDKSWRKFGKGKVNWNQHWLDKHTEHVE
jgi:hypothetical protein